MADDTFEALGVRFRVNAPALFRSELADALVDLRVIDDGSSCRTLQILERGGGYFDISWDGRLDAEGLDEAYAFYGALTAINDAVAAAAVATGYTVLHGAVVERHGRAAALVGHSGAGKTTLAAAAAIAGFGYVSDEVAAITSERLVRGYHRPAGLRRGGASMIGATIPERTLYRDTFPFVIGGRARLMADVPLGIIVLVQRREGRAELVSIAPSEALFELTTQTLGAGGREPAMFGRLDDLVRRVPVFRIHFELLDDALALLEGALAAAHV